MGSYWSSYAGSADIAAFADSDPESGEKEYDYIVCGGGTAGCVIASRLTEDPKVSVLVVEAGESDAKQIFSRIPAGWPNLFQSAADWNFKTTPQSNVGGREMYLPRGKMLGGCSAINAQIYQHCAASDYDDWAKKGADGWDWQSMKKYFRKSENYTPNPEYNVDLSERGKGGVWNTSHPPTNPISQAFLETGIKEGLPENVDYNLDRGRSGISRFQATIDSGGTRSSTSAAYLPAAVFNRPNLSILTSTHVTKLIFDNGSVKQVQLGQTKDGQRYYARAKKEVVVCLGAYGTPQLLLVSGIGGKAETQQAGSEQLVALDGVGRNLKDHIMAGPTYKAAPGTSGQYLSHPVKSFPSLVQWLWNGQGPLSSNGAEIGAFLRSDEIPGQKSSIDSKLNNASGPNAPDLELISTPVHYTNHTLGGMADPNGDYYTIFAVVLRPRSMGTVTTTNNVFEPPIIDHRYLTDPDDYDRKVLIEGIKMIRRLARVAPLSNFLLESDVPKKNVDDLSDEEISKHIDQYSETIYHPVSSCKIGPKAEGGVIDAQLKVYGVNNLRICDASIFPDAVSGHPQAAVVACAEKCAELLVSA